ncbi:MAG: EAL domain-containing protein [Myxococcota bacterium]
MTENLEKLLSDIIKNKRITPHFHPIVNLHTGDIFAYEILARGPKGSPMYSPAVLFETAKRLDLIWELDKVCRMRALEQIGYTNSAAKFFINVDPTSFDNPRFKEEFTLEEIKANNVNPAQLVLEVTERSSLVNFDEFAELLRYFSWHGVSIALDDAGAGYSGLTMLINMRPHFIKVDLELIKDIHLNALKHNLLKFLIDFSRTSGLMLIAEGIETEDQLKSLVKLGVVYGQGFYFARPGEFSPSLDERIRERVVEIGRKEIRRQYRNIHSLDVGSIMLDHPTFPAQESCKALDQYFRSHPEVLGMPIVRGDEIAGLVMRDSFYARVGTRLVNGGFAQKKASEILNQKPLIVTRDTSIEQVAMLAMTRPDANIYDFILVEDNYGYAGVVTVKHLLQTMMDYEISQARYANQLTGLPGSVVIEREVSRTIEIAPEYTAIFIDINGFKRYNDIYGFERGDEVVRFTAECLKSIFYQGRFMDAVIGHIGGDDFVVIVDSHDVEEVLQELVDAFDSRISDFYSIEDYERGYYLVGDAEGGGEERGNPYLFLNISAIQNKETTYTDLREIQRRALLLNRKSKELARTDPNRSHFVIG